MDIWPTAKRSEVMSRIRSSGNAATEGRLVAIFRSHGLTGWRRQWPLPGKPDFVFRAERVAVFVDGCFWHRCPRCFQRPATNQPFWDAKIESNVRRDRRVNCTLRGMGWRVLRIWQHDLKDGERVARRVRRLLGR